MENKIMDEIEFEISEIEDSIEYIKEYKHSLNSAMDKENKNVLEKLKIINKLLEESKILIVGCYEY
jgi:hypothetical protein